MSSRESLLSEIARRQYGVFTIAQARACGFTGAAIRGRSARGMYDRIYQGVYRVGGSELTWRGQVVASVFAVPSTQAAASHHTAAHLWGMTSIEPAMVEVVTNRHRRVHTDPFTVHESKDLVPSDVVTLDGIPTTTAVRTIVDLGASVSPRFVEHCLDVCLRTQKFSAWDVRRFIARVARSGRNGVGTIRPLIMDRLEWEGVTESVLEDRFRSLVSDHGLELPIPQFEVFDPDGVFVCRSDFAYPERKILIELDSEAYHMDPDTFAADRKKQNRSQQLGWTVFRFTWRQVTDEPSDIARLLASLTQH